MLPALTHPLRIDNHPVPDGISANSHEASPINCSNVASIALARNRPPRHVRRYSVFHHPAGLSRRYVGDHAEWSLVGYGAKREFETGSKDMLPTWFASNPDVIQGPPRFSPTPRFAAEVHNYERFDLFAFLKDGSASGLRPVGSTLI
ncbi:hypothetical protein E4U53_000254 [Claviceps sorghi]|nr:hypothetical protein E4U53_000254 [Claviceps sorghi]